MQLFWTDFPDLAIHILVSAMTFCGSIIHFLWFLKRKVDFIVVVMRHFHCVFLWTVNPGPYRCSAIALSPKTISSPACFYLELIPCSFAGICYSVSIPSLQVGTTMNEAAITCVCRCLFLVFGSWEHHRGRSQRPEEPFIWEEGYIEWDDSKRDWRHWARTKGSMAACQETRQYSDILVKVSKTFSMLEAQPVSQFGMLMEKHEYLSLKHLYSVFKYYKDKNKVIFQL